MNISILGSTGSIGQQTLDVVRHLNGIKVFGLTTNKNIELLQQQIKEFSPKAVAVMDEEKAEILSKKIEIPVYKGLDGMNKIATLQETETVVTSVVGSIGLIPTLNAIEAKKNIALANKETLVCGGEIVMNAIKEYGVKIFPIDSEHSALLQCLEGRKKEEIKKIILTCSGGSFRDYTKEQLQNVTAGDALKHPTWNMGSKITIDSATLMNKGFEVIEAHWMYGLDYEKIEVVIHPQSIIHSMVEFIDNSVIAQLSIPNMRLPIQYALTYPKRCNSLQKSIDWSNLSLNFGKPNTALFSCLSYAYEAGKIGGTLPTVLNAANEELVHMFLENKIKFFDIPNKIKELLEQHKLIKKPELDDILAVDKETKQKIQEMRNQ